MFRSFVATFQVCIRNLSDAGRSLPAGPPAARVLVGCRPAATAAGLGTARILMSMHLLGRHRALEPIEKYKLKQLEEEESQIEPPRTQAWGWKYAEAAGLGNAHHHKGHGLKSPRYYWIFSVPSYRIWQIGRSFFAVAIAAILITRPARSQE